MYTGVWSISSSLVSFAHDLIKINTVYGLLKQHCFIHGDYLLGQSDHKLNLEMVVVKM